MQWLVEALQFAIFKYIFPYHLGPMYRNDTNLQQSVARTVALCIKIHEATSEWKFSEIHNVCM